MSTDTRGSALGGALDRLDTDPARLLALGATAVLLLSSVVVFRRITRVAGDPNALVAVAVLAVVAGAMLAPVLSVGRAAVVAAVALVVGGTVYFLTLDVTVSTGRIVGQMVDDSVQLLTGASLLGIINADVWAMAGVPAPAFLTTYLALRRHYVGAVVVGGATLSVFVLTGDASALGTLFGVLGATAAVGFGDLDRRDGLESADAVAAVLAAMVVVTVSVSVVPGGGAATAPSFGGVGGSGGGSTVESNLVAADEDLQIQGSLELSPQVRFTVESPTADYWRVGSYDRYTSGGWVRTGSTGEFTGASGPPGDSQRLVQTYEAETTLRVLPAAWKPTAVRDAPTRVLRTTEGGLTPGGSVAEGDRYTVVSRVPDAGPRQLRSAGTDYPDRVERRYTQLPSDVPDRVTQRTDRITANAENPYDTARVIERWLENNREYSLDVQRPDGDIADSFLFEMDAGYCTYFATTMVVMLRSQGVPARFVVGYTPGERVDRDRWVARGLDSHAWVEVYFPDVGWVRFDPTPAGPRQAAEQTQVSEARENNVSDVDTSETGAGEWTPTPEESDPDPNETFRTPDLADRIGTDVNSTGTPAGPGFTPGDEGGDGDGSGPVPAIPLPSRQQAALGAVVLAGAFAGARRAGLTDRAYRELWVRYQPRSEPRADVERAYRRVVWRLERRRRARHPGETPRQYLRAVGDERARRLGDLYERARYAGRADEADADEAVALADELVRDGSRLPWP